MLLFAHDWYVFTLGCNLQVLMLGMGCTLLGSAIWVLFATSMQVMLAQFDLQTFFMRSYAWCDGLMNLVLTPDARVINSFDHRGNYGSWGCRLWH